MTRMNALWGKGERDGARRAPRRSRLGIFAATIAALALAAPVTASAGTMTLSAEAEMELFYSEEEMLVLESAAWAEAAWAE